MSNFLYSAICAVKFYLLWVVCKFMFTACYKLCKLTSEQTEIYRMLYQQNKAILNKESITLLSNQIVDVAAIDGVKKNANKLALHHRLNQMNFEDL